MKPQTDLESVNVAGRRAEPRVNTHRQTVVIVDKVAFAASVVDSSSTGVGLLVTANFAAQVGSNVTIRYRQQDINGTIRHKLVGDAGGCKIGIQLDGANGLEIFGTRL